MADSPKGFEACVVAGPEGPALYLNNYRIAGPKPWAGSVTAEWKGRTVEDLFAAVPELRALRESHDALETALRELVECEELEMQSYGSFPGGDPRCFTPDEEVNTPEELAAWRAACEAWERGEGQDTGPQCQTMGDGSVVTGTGFGMGVTIWTHPAVEVARAALAKAEALHG